jgi:hypothetical protein
VEAASNHTGPVARCVAATALRLRCGDGVAAAVRRRRGLGPLHLGAYGSAKGSALDILRLESLPLLLVFGGSAGERERDKG